MSFEGCSNLLAELLGTPLGELPRSSPEPAKDSSKKWKFGKPVWPQIIVKRREFNGEAVKAGNNLVELHCGCKCEECISNYKAYWTEKTYSKDIASALASEKEVRKEVLAEIQRIEMTYKKQVHELQVSLEVVDGKRKTFSEALESERQLRAEEVYRREVQKEELNALVEERIRLEAKVLQQERELASYRQEDTVLKEAARSAIILKDKAVAKLREYEAQINILERDNGEYRYRLNNAEIEAATLKYKNGVLKEKLDSIRPHEIFSASAAGARGRGRLPEMKPITDGGTHGSKSAGISRQSVAQTTNAATNRKAPSKLSSLQGSMVGLSTHFDGIDEQPSVSVLSSMSGNYNYW